MKKYKIGFDIGGVITTHTSLLRDIISILAKSDKVELFIVTDMEQDVAKELLEKNHFHFDSDHVLSADWLKYESRCKEEICKEYGIDILLDDYMPYLTGLSTTLGVLLMPKNNWPYNPCEWEAS